MDIFIFFTGGLVFFVALFKRELLIEKESFRLILGISIALFLAGLMLHFTEAGRDSSSGALLAPLLSLGLFRLCRKIFLKRYGREPRDTFFVWEAGLAADRFFNIAYFSLAGWLWMLAAIGMIELAKASW